MESAKYLILNLTLVSFIIIVFCNPIPESDTYPVESKELFQPPLEEIINHLKENLTTIFENVEVSIVDCPDLSISPFFLASQGLSGSPTIFESGSEKYLFPVPIKSKYYDFKDVPQQTGVYPTFMIGAGAGPFRYLNTSSEIIPDLKITNGHVHSLTQIGTVKDGKLYTEVLPQYVTNYGFMVNLFVSQGKPGKVIEVKASKRIGDDNFPSTIRETLRNAYPGESIGLGGTFLIKHSSVNILVQPQFSKIPLLNDQMKNEWLAFFNVSAPLVAIGTLVTNDPGLEVRPYHFHLFNDHGEAGHYRFDLEPETVEYVGYFKVGERFVRVDRPKPQTQQ